SDPQDITNRGWKPLRAAKNPPPCTGPAWISCGCICRRFSRSRMSDRSHWLIPQVPSEVDKEGNSRTPCGSRRESYRCVYARQGKNHVSWAFSIRLDKNRQSWGV